MLCNVQDEDASHLFLTCDFPRNIRGWWLQINNMCWVFDNSLSCCFQQWKRPSWDVCQKKIWKSTFLVIVWSILKERNNRIFSGEVGSMQSIQEMTILRLVWWTKSWLPTFPYSADEVARNLAFLFNFRNRSHKCDSRNLMNEEVLSWSPPPEGCLKWNTDASCA